jgi:putative tricarboxylic transport membrane protein
MLQDLIHGLTSLGSVSAVAYLIGGALLGVFVGVVPGLSTAVVLSVLLSFIYNIDLTGTLCLFLGSQAGSFYSASITSILLNTPAHPEAFAITFDGYPMARRGEAGRALGLSAASTCLGGLIGCAALIGFIPLLDQLPQIFHPPEYVALVVLAMLLVGTLGTDSIGKALAAGGAGLLVSTIGPAPIGGQARFTFGSIDLESGIALAAVALGVFAIPQMAMVFGTGTTVANQDMTGKDVGPGTAVRLGRGSTRQILGGGLETLRHWNYVLQGGVTGAIAGIIPGIGAFAANFLSYGVAQQFSRNRKKFGTGTPEGVVAPEGASLAKEAGSMIPILGLAIPGGIGGALFLAALTIKGVRTGFGFAQTYPVLPYQIVWIIALSGIIGTTVGVLVGPVLTKVMAVPGPILVPFILSLAVVGAFLVDTQMSSVYEVLAFGVIGLGLRRLRYPLAAFLIGIVLGPLLETNIFLTKNAFPGASFLWERPLADVLGAIAILVLVLKVRTIRQDQRAAREGQPAVAAAGRISLFKAGAAAASPGGSAEAAYPVLALVMTTFLLAGAGFAIGYAAANYPFDASVMPVISGAIVALPCLWMLPRDVLNFRVHLKNRATARRGDVVANSAAAVVEIAPIEVPSTVPDELSSAAPAAAEANVQARVAAQVGSAPVVGAGTAGGAAPRPLGSADDQPGTSVPPDPPDAAPAGGFPAIRDKAWGRHGQYTRELVVYAWLIGLVVMCWAFGFVVGVPVFVVAYSFTCVKRYIRSIWYRGLFAALAAAAMWLITDEALNALNILIEPAFHL